MRGSELEWSVQPKFHIGYYGFFFDVTLERRYRGKGEIRIRDS